MQRPSAPKTLSEVNSEARGSADVCCEWTRLRSGSLRSGSLCTLTRDGHLRISSDKWRG